MRKEMLKGTLFGFIIAGLMGAGVAGFAHERGGGRNRDEVIEQKVESALRDLEVIERLNDRSKDRRVKVKIHERIHDLRAELKDIDVVLDDRGDHRDDDDHGHRADVMTEAEIDAIIDAVEQAYSSRSKLQLIRDACNGRWIRTAQVIRLMEEMSFSADRIEIAAMLHGNVADEGQFYKVYNHLPFDTDRETLRQRLGQ